MFIDYLFSSPKGDILLEPEDLARPFLLSPSAPHPFLTLRDYFEAIQTFLLRDEGTSLMSILKARGIGPDEYAGIQRMGIRSEKHGVLYHVASVEILFHDTPIRLAVSTAVSEQGKACLANEYDMLKLLHQSFRRSYLPEVYEKGDVVCQDGQRHRETMTLMLSEWFEGFHEWHFSTDEKDSRQRVCIWDLEKGHRYASDNEMFDLFRQASNILTLCYDIRTFKQVYPWHHAAGDFIVKTGDNGIQVRLSTVRDYRSIMDYLSEDAVHPVIALVYFFLNLTIQMRLDKLDGVGKTVWAGDFSVQAVTQGFFDALEMNAQEEMSLPVKTQELLSLLQSFDEDEFERLTVPLIDFYRHRSAADFPVIDANLKRHLSLLSRVLHQFRR